MGYSFKFAGVNSITFHQRFKTEADCLEYLSLLKWEEGYRCKKCNNDIYCSGKRPFNRRCSKCRYDESPTSGTMFDKVKFSILKAFHIAFKIATKKKGMSSLELSHEFELRQKTCWEFKWKLQQAMESSLRYPLTGIVHVDEFWIGESEPNKPGRSNGKKKQVVLALEILEEGVGRAYAEVIENASSKELGRFLKRYVSNEANLISDGWRGYLPLKKHFGKLEQVASDNGKNFINIHIHIMNIKGWLRGIHHHCSKNRLQGYLDEYHFRYNRREHMGTIFNLLLKRMMKNQPKRL
jgi:hypothetical protein